MAGETTGLMSAQTASKAVGLFKSTTESIKKARDGGAVGFRMMGFLGGIAVVITNALSVLGRITSFDLTGALIAIYCILFGIVIFMLDAPGPCGVKLQTSTKTYCKFLEFTWGRGLLYFFVGSLQFSNWNLLDWVVGGFMMFVGIIALSVGYSAARDMRVLQLSFKNEEMFKQKWDEFDADRNGHLDIKELSALVRDANLNMTNNEMSAIFLALDKNFDEKISYQEFHDWWKGEGAHKNRSLIV